MDDAQTEKNACSGRTILAVFAHPDDESLACGGTLARLADSGARVVLLCASRGESGSVRHESLVDVNDLGRVRSEELLEAARTLGIADVLICDHPDGDLRWADVSEFHEEIVAAIGRYRPDGVITFAEDGLYWHLDHIGVHERTYTAVRSLGADAPPLYYVTIPKGVMRAVVEAEHRAPRTIRVALLDELTRRGGRGLQVHDRNAVHDRKDAALATQDAVLDLVAAGAVIRRLDEVERPAAVRAPEDIERRRVHALGTGSPICSMIDSQRLSVGARRKCSSPSSRLASASSIRANG